ncbi:MAG TPA: oxidoreductase [Pseudonocardia sp.]|jgi:NAD(P)-dependent dehydrogenase (short-subunit alcohol dehydrogenase family)|uniref:oxidoreductase n=1 Tax=Pseudonocardia sp. TaxID=60912 RepID=UPI002B4B6BA4|nr:oxidoreductase [Pseudonocardia sp.]HLU55935.1 oxidoreductase [Pseudonocardia sp.]
MPLDSSPVFFITGCSTGLGRALATHVLERGWRAAVTAREPGSVADLVDAHGARAIALPLDVTDPEQVSDAVRCAEEVFGRIDVLGNNAGYGYLAAIEEGEDAEVRALFEANVFGAVAVTKAVLPGMRTRRRGHVVTVSSLGGLAAFAATGYYHATKFALEGLSESLAAEVAPLGIGVTIVEPGAFRTNWSGPSMKQSAVRIDDYADTAGTRRDATLATYGTQPGDPARAAAAIVAALEADAPPLRLVLGTAALQVARGKLAALQRGFDEWEHLSRSTEIAASPV